VTPPPAAAGALVPGDRSAALASLRAATGVGLADVARVTGYPITRLLRLEHGEAAVDPGTYLQICGAIDEILLEKARREG
jgi:transcriptional regulator with XRE-family HTH domain